MKSIDIQEKTINLKSSEKPVARIAGEVLQMWRVASVAMMPGSSNLRMAQEIKKENGEVERRKNFRSIKK